jgi:hypothetical protein
MAKNCEMLLFGGLHEKHTVQSGIWVPTQHSVWDERKPRKTLIELAGRRTFQMQTVEIQFGDKLCSLKATVGLVLEAMLSVRSAARSCKQESLRFNAVPCES